MMILDGFISIVFDNDYALIAPIFIPALATCSFMLSVREMNYRNALEFAIVVGLFMAFFEPMNIWVYVISYMFVTIVVKTWSISISDSFIEQLVLCVLAIFVKEAIVFIAERLYDNTNISVFTWVYKVLFKTILFNVPLAIFVIFMNKRKNEIVGDIVSKKKKKEKVFWGD